MVFDVSSRHPGRVRYALTLSVIAVALTACGSSGPHGHRSSGTSSAGDVSTPAPAASSSTSVATVSPTSAGPTPISLPSQKPAPVVKRKVSRPAGLAPISGNLCDAAVFGGAPGLLHTAMTRYRQPDQQINQVGAAAGVLEVSLPGAQKARAALVKAGYRTSFAAVQDLTEMIPIEQGVISAYRSRNLDPIPALYLKLITAGNQYVADSDAAYKSGRDFCTD
ncbi:hypothetical protein [uncultured Jatrophihabitans sp.]|uniref:hypothetical protein n=1 Tax=uncultured Jatrophihabitans sp. TaxID=1610747 RepID=UPI0035CB0F38